MPPSNDHITAQDVVLRRNSSHRYGIKGGHHKGGNFNKELPHFHSQAENLRTRIDSSPVTISPLLLHRSLIETHDSVPFGRVNTNALTSMLSLLGVPSLTFSSGNATCGVTVSIISYVLYLRSFLPLFA